MLMVGVSGDSRFDSATGMRAQSGC
jgi:hypothetical protein